MKLITFIFKTVVIAATLFICGCDSLIRDYELDLDADLLKDMKMLQYIEEGYDSTLTIYYEAVKYAGIESQIAKGKQTRIVPTNNAMRNLLTSIGATKISDISPNVLKNLFTYLIIPEEFRSLTIKPDIVNVYKTLSGDSLFVTRNSAHNDPYRMFINSPEGFIPASVQIMKQDYVFKDGIMQVVEMFPVYRRNVLIPDPTPEGVDYSSAQKDTILISEDTQVYMANKTRNYGDNFILQLCPRPGQVRYSYMKFDTKPISFLDDLVSARLNFYVSRIVGASYVPLCGFYEVSTDWEEYTMDFNTRPAFGAEIATKSLVLVWNRVDFTSFVKGVYEKQQQSAAFGLALLNGADITGSIVDIRHREHATHGPYISLMSAITSELRLDVSLPVTINATNEIAILTKDNLSMSGESSIYNYSDKNIIYVLATPPENGTLTYYGLPLRRNNRFTQHDLAAGAIKYIGNDMVVNDSFVLKAQDYIGGVYPELIEVLVR